MGGAAGAAAARLGASETCVSHSHIFPAAPLPPSFVKPHTPPYPPARLPQLFDECEVVAVVGAPAALGVEALLQHAEPGCAARPYGYRCVGKKAA